MATTSIWRVKGWLGKVVVYVENPDKTENPHFFEKQDIADSEIQGLSDVIDYAVNDEKTKNNKSILDDETVPVMERFVSGVNCLPENARTDMEVKINREIREYTESMFFGLSLRQFVFSLAAVLVAVGIYFILKPHLGTETVSWVCVLGAAPFAALGFIRYNGMTAERFILVWLRSEFLMPKRLTFRATNIYYEAIKGGKRK